MICCFLLVGLNNKANHWKRTRLVGSCFLPCLASYLWRLVGTWCLLRAETGSITFCWPRHLLVNVYCSYLALLFSDCWLWCPLLALSWRLLLMVKASVYFICPLIGFVFVLIDDVLFLTFAFLCLSFHSLCVLALGRVYFSWRHAISFSELIYEYCKL